MGLEQLSGQRQVVRPGEAHEHDRPVPGNTVRPQPGLSQAVGGHGGGRAEGRAGVDHVPASRWNSWASPGDRPRSRSSVLAAARARSKVPAASGNPVLTGQGQGFFPALGRRGREGDGGRSARPDADAAAEAEDRVQHRAGGARQDRPRVQGGGVGGATAPAQEAPGPSRTADRRRRGRPPTGCEPPRSAPGPCAGAPAAQQGGPVGEELCSRNSLPKAGWAWSARRGLRATSA